MLRNATHADVQLIVATDNERILGLGDQGAGGMGIPVGKLSLYSAAAGIHPARCLPVSLDVGTNNRELLNDTYYLGYRHRRLQDEPYWKVLDAFIAAVKEVFPHCLVQWEDFRKNVAFAVLERYRQQIPSFNDDIQGTAAVGLAGVLAALRITGRDSPNRESSMLGRGLPAWVLDGSSPWPCTRKTDDQAKVHAAQVFVDTRGLMHQGSQIADPHKRPFALNEAAMAIYGFRGDTTYDLSEVIRRVRPTVLIGTTAQPGTFTEPSVRAMAQHAQRPIILPLSNPTSKVECTPAQAIRWTEGLRDRCHGHRLRSSPLRGQDLRHRAGKQRFHFPRHGAGMHFVGRSGSFRLAFFGGCPPVGRLCRPGPARRGGHLSRPEGASHGGRPRCGCGHRRDRSPAGRPPRR